MIDLLILFLIPQNETTDFDISIKRSPFNCLILATSMSFDKTETVRFQNPSKKSNEKKSKKTIQSKKKNEQS